MSIIFSTIAPARPACPPPARIYFEAPDDALLARVTEKVASILGRHQAYVFHEPSEVPAGLVPVVLSRAEVCPELALDTLAASPTPPAEQQAQPGAVYAELPAPTASIGTDDAWHEAAMRDFADRTHAARLRCKSEQARLATLWGYVRADAAPKAAPAQQAGEAAESVPAVDERAAFEAQFPVPGGVHWDGTEYVVKDSHISSYRCNRFEGQWEAWKARASHWQAPAGAGEYPALVCDYCGALTPDPWHSSGMLHGKMSKHIHSCDACAAREAAPPPSPTAQAEGWIRVDERLPGEQGPADGESK